MIKCRTIIYNKGVGKQDRYTLCDSSKVKAKYNFTCAHCGATENIQAHAPNGDHSDWHKGIALCGDCHSLQHPGMAPGFFGIKGHQPYWPNVSARTLAKEFNCHNRTIIRIALKLNIPRNKNLSSKDRRRLKNNIHLVTATILCKCSECGIIFEGKSQLRARIRNNKSGLYFCSNKCKGRWLGRNHGPSQNPEFSQFMIEWHHTHINPWEGKHHSIETKTKISLSQKIRWARHKLDRL